MAAEAFNSLGGYTIGIPAVAVVDSSGTVVANVVTNGSVNATIIRSNDYRFANNQPFLAPPGGSNTQLQFNDNGILGGIPNVTWNGNILNLGNIESLAIAGGSPGYVLSTDGNGVLSWSVGGGGGGNGSPGGANTYVQYNNNGEFGGDGGFVYNEVSNTLTVSNLSITESIFANTVNATGNISALYFKGDGSQLTDISVDIANYVVQPNQSNITSLGTLTYLNLNGPIISTGNISTSANITAGNIAVSRTISASSAVFTNAVSVGTQLTINSSATLRVLGNFNADFSPNVNLGTLSNVHITGGVNGYVLATDGTGNLSWVAQSGGGGGNGYPAGSNTQVQFNKDGLFAASPYLTFNDWTNTFQVGGNLIANSFQMGAGAYKWSTSQVYFATTASTSPGQVLYSIPVDQTSGVEFEIIATEPSGPSRQSLKISSMYYNGTVQFTEYASLFVNGGVGNFEVDFNAGNIIVPPALELKVTPNTSNPVTYKMLITVYAD